MGALVDPEDHVCINVALYGRVGHRWAMTERGRQSLQRTARSFQVGPSQLSYDGQCFMLRFDEVQCPWPRKLQGTVRVHPRAFTQFETTLDDWGRHRWGPIAPCSRVEVDLPQVGLRWSGQGYLDSNSGDEPIHVPFRSWDWSRAVLPDGRTAVIYDVQQRQGPGHVVSRLFDANGRDEPLEAPARVQLPRTAWGIRRHVHSDTGFVPRVSEVFEDTPFYVRDVVSTSLLGHRVTSVHETLDTNRLVSWPVQLMLPFRMPRRA